MDPRIHAWTRELALWWAYYVREYGVRRMRPPVFRIVEQSPLGTWDGAAREIRLALHHVAGDPWHEVMATLRHEMAHQFVDEVLHATEEPPHGPTFRRVCRQFRVEARATASGPDLVAAAAGDEAARITRRVSKLLALGGSPNENEAAAAMRKARQLMLEHNLDVVQRDAARGFAMRPVGPVKRRHFAWEHTLAAILSEFFFVEVIWSPDYDAAATTRGTSLLLHGTPPNLEMAEYVHGYLSALLPHLWREHRRAHGLERNGGRLDFFDGVLQGFRAKLQDAEHEHRAGAPRALVWRGDPKLGEYYRWLHPGLRVRRTAPRNIHDTWYAGQEAGQSVTIHRPLGEGPASTIKRLPG